LLRLQLVALGYEVDHAVGANDAIRFASTNAYDIYILNNWWLTDGDAIELCRELRRTHPTTPILFYSSNALPSEVAKARDAGAQAYIPLPDTSGQLPRTMEQLVHAAERSAAPARSAGKDAPDY
jgi:DNA-binding response OmpR family regulator